MDVHWHESPKAMKAGGWGGVVFRAVWEICKARDKPGILSKDYWEAKYLAKWTLFYEERGGVKGIERGMKAALAAGMLERLPNGDIKVPGWDRYQVDATSAERKRQWKSKQDNKLQDKGTGQNGGERKGTEGNGEERKGTPDRTGQDNTIQEEDQERDLSRNFSPHVEPAGSPPEPAKEVPPPLPLGGIKQEKLAEGPDKGKIRYTGRGDLKYDWLAFKLEPAAVRARLVADLQKRYPEADVESVVRNMESWMRKNRGRGRKRVGLATWIERQWVRLEAERARARGGRKGGGQRGRVAAPAQVKSPSDWKGVMK